VKGVELSFSGPGFMTTNVFDSFQLISVSRLQSLILALAFAVSPYLNADWRALDDGPHTNNTRVYLWVQQAIVVATGFG